VTACVDANRAINLIAAYLDHIHIAAAVHDYTSPPQICDNSEQTSIGKILANVTGK
jgi:hypothetical protein